MKRIISMLLALCMILSCIPGTASAHQEHEESHLCQEMLLTQENFCSEPLAEDDSEDAESHALPGIPAPSRKDFSGENTAAIAANREYRPMSITPRISPWVSETEYGDECEGNLIAGRRYYFNYWLYDANTGADLDDTGYYDYEVFLAIIDPDGDVVHSYTFTDDQSWISAVLNSTGTYTFYWEVSGRFEGDGSFTYNVVSGSSGTTYGVSCDTSSVSLEVGESYTAQVWKTGTHSSQSFRWDSTDRAVATCTWGSQTSSGTWPLTITGNSDGTATITVMYMAGSGSSTILATTEIYVTVSNSSNCTLSFASASGTSNVPSSVTAARGSYVSIPSNVPNYFGYAFCYWQAEDSDGDIVRVYPGESFYVYESLDFEAYWYNEELDLYSLYLSGDTMELSNEVEFSNQVFYYYFTPGGSSSTPLTYVFEATGSYDDRVFLYNASGTEIDSDDDGGSGHRQFRMEHTFYDNQTYYLKVRMYSDGTGTIPFEITCLNEPPVEEYTLTFNADGGTGAPSSVTAIAGNTITIPSTIPTASTFGVAFDHWEAEDSAGDTVEVYPGQSFTVTEDLTFYAVWNEPEELEIADLIGTDDTIDATAEINYASQVRYYLIYPGASSDFPIEYRFWSTGSSDTHVTLYDSDGSEIARDDDSGGSRQFRLTRTFYDNEAYYLKVRFQGTGTGNIPFHVSCLSELPTCTLTLNDMNGEETTLTATRNGTVTIPDEIPGSLGETFMGWGNESGELLYDPGEEVTLTSDMTLYAYYMDALSVSTTTATVVDAYPYYCGGYYWFSFVPSVSTNYLFQSQEADVDNYIVIYDEDGDLIGENDDDGADDLFRLECYLTAYNTYYIGVAVDDGPEDFSFLVDRGYRITYNANGGSNAPSLTYAYHQSGGTLSEIVPTNDDGTFLGWATTASATAPVYDPGDSISVTADTTLYAVWQSGACEHNWASATCEEPITCTICGETVGEPLGHTWRNADCENPKTCTRCSATEGDALGHDWADADCNNPSTCRRCGETSDGPRGHDWQDATCTTPKTCRSCRITEGTALGHDWQDPTCEDPYTCSRCSETVGSPLGHTWQDATCTTPKTCTRCSATEGTALGHDWQNATCETPKTCRRCSVTEGSALGHNYADGACTRCGDPEPRPSTEGLIRLAGSNRYETGFSIANQLKENMGVDRFQTVVVAYGQNFPDALTGSYLAAVKNAPILLTQPSADNDVLAYLRENVVSGGTVYILGGTSAVTETFEIAARYSGFHVQRLMGADRYETNLKILEEARVNSSDAILIATGKNYADSLSASATGLPMLLVDKTLTDAQRAFLQTTSKNFVILGGTSAVSAEIEAELTRIGSVTRVKGTDRYLTSVLIARKYFPSADAAVLAYGQGFPDGLCGGPLAISMGAPLILTSNENPAAADGYVQGITTGAVTGGTTRISDDTVRAIFDVSYDTPITLK